jgi:GNAT superfamily N-acetyltransferase
MPETVSLTRVVTERQRRTFLELPYRLYRDDAAWIPRLWPEQMSWLRREHAFFNEGDAEWFLALRGDEAVGTIGVAVNHRVNRHERRNWGIFGFFEFVEEPAVFEALVGQARAWLRLRGATHMVGPESFGESDYPGFLVGRHDVPAALYEGHTPPYYLRFAEQAGWTKRPDNIAYRFLRQKVGEGMELIPAKMSRVAARVARNPRVAIRHADLSRFDEEFELFLDLYNRALLTLPAFTPESRESFRRFADDLRPVLDEELVLFALVDGKEVGFSLALRNVAEAFRKSGGLRFPWQYPRLAWEARRVRGVSFKILAVDPAYWGMGLEALMFVRIGEVCLRRGYTWLDASLTGEDNPQTNKISTRLGGEEYKRYRTYLVEV